MKYEIRQERLGARSQDVILRYRRIGSAIPPNGDTRFWKLAAQDGAVATEVHDARPSGCGASSSAADMQQTGHQKKGSN
eukprot:2802600-Pleurochrysis_carterae.AAC.2